MFTVPIMKIAFSPFLALAGGVFMMAASPAINASAADGAPPWNVRVAGISIVAPEGPEGLPVFNSKPGTTVTLILSPPSGRIVGNSFSDSKLASFTDDKGTDLLAVESKDRFQKPGLNIWSSSGDETNGAAAQRGEVYVAGLPAKGATSLHFTGKAVFRTASERRQFTVADVELKAGSKFDIGDFPVSITGAGLGKGMFGGKDTFNLTLSCPKNLESIASLDLYDAQGNSLGAKRSSWGGMLGSYFVEYTLKKNADHAKLVASRWTDWKTSEVPIDLTVGLGL